MLSAIKNRGPDSFGIEKISHNWLGHQRLSIQDLTSAGHQPMTSPCSRFTIIFNGEIYNYKTLAAELTAKGCTLNSSSDTEVLLRLFEREGINCLDRLVGMFSFQIFDKLKNTVYLVRDRFGIKPMYYGFVDNSFIAGSDLHCFTREPRFKKEINIEAVESYFLYRYIPAPLTIWKGYYKLRPGHYLKYQIDSQDIEIKNYYDIFEKIQTKKESRIPELFAESIQRRLIADVDIATFLSGGLDSSLVTAFAKKEKENLSTYTIGFEPKEYSEHHYAEAMARDLNTKNNVKIMSGLQPSDIESVFAAYDEPFADSSMFPTFFLSKEVSRKFKVALSGDGGDELFAGYSWYRESDSLFSGNFFEPYFFPNKYRHRVAKRYCDRLLQRFNLENIHLLTGHKPLLQDYIFERFIKGSSVRTLQLIDIHTFMVDDILLKVDKASMANSLEVRLPFLDHYFVEAVLSTPPSTYPTNSADKKFMESIFKNDLPSWVFQRNKKGFSAPMHQWLNCDRLSKDSFPLCWKVGKINPKFMESSFYLSHPNKSNINWMLYCYEKWLEKYYDYCSN